MAKSDEAKTLLHTLWPAGIPAGEFLVITTINSDGMLFWKFFSDIDAAAEWGVKRGQKFDAYFGIATMPDELTLKDKGIKRGTKDDAMSVPALWLDIDIKPVRALRKGTSATEKKTFASQADALEFVDSLPRKPTAGVWSGAGLHCYWCFDSPYRIESAEMRDYIERLAVGWLTHARNEAKKPRFGAHVDSVVDLARIFRLPGTKNFKYEGDPLPTSIAFIHDEVM